MDYVPGVGLMAGVVALGSQGPEFKSHLVVELIPGGVDFTWLVGILCRSGDPSGIVPNSQGDYLGSTNALHRIWSHLLLSFCECNLYLIIKIIY